MIVIVIMFLYIRRFDPSVEMGLAVASGEPRGLSGDGPWCVWSGSGGGWAVGGGVLAGDSRVIHPAPVGRPVVRSTAVTRGNPVVKPFMVLHGEMPGSGPRCLPRP